MEGLGLVHGNTVLDLRACFPLMDRRSALTDVHVELAITRNGRDVWRCTMNFNQLLILPETHPRLICSAFLRLRPYHEFDAIVFWSLWTCDFAWLASTEAIKRGTGLKLVAEIRTGSSPLPDQLEPEYTGGKTMLFTTGGLGPYGSTFDVKMDSVRYDGDGLSEKSCPICLEDFNLGMELAKTPCGHVFHLHCMRRMLEWSHSCPLCRFHVVSNISS